ncbi:RagB/SusD family nutrient uptake outer membrane protein [Pedobacter frigiditerrae]|uniref:RagB/SusD family nutrient uptake outer membrane protein n=1 Tax=Pedobacter frigiditerrae TaxID=2530452 RepID=A0A4R0MKX1_9SPHI|nr:RagB/SusD family nutrient uptake outer membrane protein [Pedobacter frigiditerrae]TCC87309.1 RagB/SusD family nutrient uptake outer membrane protein [Pedobacter frigiditerrae]
MKKNQNIIIKKVSIALFICAGIALTFSGCKKTFLQPEPLSFFEPGETFTTKSGLDAAVAIADRHLRSYWTFSAYTDLSLPISTEYMFSDMDVASKTDDGNIFTDMATRLTPTDMPERVPYFWGETYNGIKYANTILTFIDGVQGLDETTKNQYKGRALFHRSWRYMALCFQFKDVPFVTKIVSVPKVNYRSTKREAILKKITEDMEQAVQWVPDQKDMTLRGLVNKGACRQLLIKCYLATGQFDKAIAQADLLINSSGYSLNMNNFGNFYNPYPNTWPITRNVIWDLHRPENKSIAANTEAILIMPNRNATDMGIKMNSMRNWGPFLDNIGLATPDAKQAIRYLPAANASYRANLDYVHAIGRGIAHIRPTYFAQRSLWYVNGVNDAGDLRHSNAVGNWIEMEDLKYNEPTSTFFGQNVRLRNATGGLLCADTIRQYFAWPHYKYYIEDPIESLNPNEVNHRGGAGDLYLYRLAETYLLRAEAKFYKGDIAGATADVNKIRERAKCTQMYTTVTIGDIMNERARELNKEEWRFTELSRVSYALALSGKSDEWGNTYTVDNLATNSYWYQRIQHYSDFYNKGKVQVRGRSYTMAPHNINWPIPNGSIQSNGGAQLWQNQGYTGYNPSIKRWDTWQEAVADEDITN